MKVVNVQTRVCSNHDFLENFGAKKDKGNSKYEMCIVVGFIDAKLRERVKNYK